MTYAENRRRSILRIENHPDAVGGCYQRQKDNIAVEGYALKAERGSVAEPTFFVPERDFFPPTPPFLTPPCPSPSRFLSSRRDSLSSPILLSLAAASRPAFFAPKGFLYPHQPPLPHGEPTPTAVTADSFSVPKGLLSLPQPLLPRRRLATTAEPFSRQPLRG